MIWKERGNSKCTNPGEAWDNRKRAEKARLRDRNRNQEASEDDENNKQNKISLDFEDRNNNNKHTSNDNNDDDSTSAGKTESGKNTGNLRVPRGKSTVKKSTDQLGFGTDVDNLRKSRIS